MLTFTNEQKQELLLWAKWLETTNLKQGKGAFKRRIWSEQNLNEYEYCCLGVYIENKHPDDWIAGADNLYWIREIFGDFLPIDGKRLGLGQHIQIQKYIYSLKRIFILLNDVIHYSFPQIAKVIYYLVENEEIPNDVAELIILWENT